jgi:magnesium-transporting ATPase (P-type)
MLTGDKVETAICVGRGVKLIQGREELLYVIEGVKTIPDFHTKLHEFYALNNIKSPEELEMTDRINCVLVIDGTSLKIALMEIEEEFFRIAVKLPAIICSRVSPTQKA